MNIRTERDACSKFTSASREALSPQGLDIPAGIVTPAGAPSWITRELIVDTIETWQPYYEKSVTAQDALEILLNFGNMLDVLGESA